MTKKPHRTHPLDRDGDGQPGGSLPGNQTAPMASKENTAAHPTPGATVQPSAHVRSEDANFVEPVDDLADARTTPGDSPEKPEPSERDTDNANAQADAGDEDDADDPHADCVHCGDSHPVGALDHDLCPACVDEAPILDQLDAAMESAQGDTFDAEQVQASQDTIRKVAEQAAATIEEEGETTRPPEAAAQPMQGDDGLVTLDTETAPVAVRIRELRLLLDNRRLYKSPHGYSPTYAPPYVDQATVDVWIKAGLAEDVPSAGNMGGVRALAEARRALRVHLNSQAEAA